MTTTQKIEIFGDKEKELKVKFEAEGYDWKEIRKELKELSGKEKKEDIDRKLSELQGNVDEQFLYLKGLLEKHRIELKKKGGEGLVDKAKDKVKEKIEEEKQKLTDSFKKRAKEIPLIGGLLVKSFDWVQENKNESPDDGFMTKTKKGFFGWLGGSILLLVGGFIGYDKFKDDINSIASKVGGEVTEGIDSVVGKVKEEGKQVAESTEQVGGAVATAQEKVEDLITPEKRINAYHTGGLFMIKNLSGVPFSKEDTKAESIYPMIENIPLKVIKDSLTEYYKDNNFELLVSKLGLKGVNIQDKDGIEKTLLSIVSDNSINVISSRLKDFKELFKYDLLKEKFGDDFANNVSNKSSFNDLTLKEASILFSLSIPSFLNEIGTGIASSLGGLYGNVSSELGELKNEFSERSNNLLSKKILLNFYTKKFGSKGLINEKPEVVIREFTSGLSETEIEQLKNLIKFKDQVITIIKNNNKLNFDMSNFSQKFDENLNYSSIIELYLLLDGDVSKLDNMDLLTKMGVLFIIRDSFKDEKLRGEFEGVIITEIKKTFDKSPSLLTNDESLFLQTHMNSFLKSSIEKYVEFITEVRGSIKSVIKSEIEAILNIKIPDDVSDYGEYITLISAAGLLWKLKSFTPAGVIWLGALGLGNWGLSIVSDTDLYKQWVKGKIKFSPEMEVILNNLQK